MFVEILIILVLVFLWVRAAAVAVDPSSDSTVVYPVESFGNTGIGESLIAFGIDADDLVHINPSEDSDEILGPVCLCEYKTPCPKHSKHYVSGYLDI